jgi:hypothetical protein
MVAVDSCDLSSLWTAEIHRAMRVTLLDVMKRRENISK